MLAESEKKGYAFGTFGGVFTPSILTIFGLVMFMRTSYVVGSMGIGKALLILLIAESITIATGLSISVISTNTPVRGGGAYFLISRALGPGFGSSIGLSLYMAQTLSVPFYIMGFAEATATNFPVLQPYFLFLCLVPAFVLFITAWIGTDWAIKAQYIILGVLTAAIIAFLGGALFKPFSFEQFSVNFPGLPDQDFFYFFAIFFPAVTGFMAGVNMSGDLKDPAVSIPRGTILAILTGAVVYALQIILTGGAFSQENLIDFPYTVLARNALFGGGFLVFAGVVAATLSSALGSMLGAPRILQALAGDRILRSLNFFAVGFGRQNEPRRAMLLTFAISIGVLFWGGVGGMTEKSSHSNSLNMVAEVVSMFFLYTYAMVNLAAFVESFGANPSFRPRFRFFHWSMSLFGASACVITSLMINAVSSIIALAIIGFLFLICRRRVMENAFGDARRGFIFSRISENLKLLAKMPPDPKNWRPTITVLSGDPSRRVDLIEYATLFSSRKGILSLVKIVTDPVEDLMAFRQQEFAALERFAAVHRFGFFPDVIVSEDFDNALKVFLQSHSLGPIKPNIIMAGWPRNPERIRPFLNHVNTVCDLRMNCLLMINARNMRLSSMPVGTIDVWWRGKDNGSLMLIMAYLLTINRGWKNVSIRLLRMAPREERKAAEEELRSLTEAARIPARIKVISSEKTFDEMVEYISRDALVIFMGFSPPPPEKYDEFFAEISERSSKLTTTFLVSSNGEADLLA